MPGIAATSSFIPHPPQKCRACFRQMKLALNIISPMFPLVSFGLCFCYQIMFIQHTIQIAIAPFSLNLIVPHPHISEATRRARKVVATLFYGNRR